MPPPPSHVGARPQSDDVFAGADEVSSLGDEPALGRGSSDDQWDAAGTSSSATTHAYALRANPNRLMRSCQECKNCRKEFASCERLLEHGRCDSDDDEDRADEDRWPHCSLSPLSDAGADSEDDPAVSGTAGWSKGKRSHRVKSTAAADDASAVPPSR
jgi:hypothetical protein